MQSKKEELNNSNFDINLNKYIIVKTSFTLSFQKLIQFTNYLNRKSFC